MGNYQPDSSVIHTYWDFPIESIAWKTHTEIFSSNHIANRLSHTWEKPFHPIRNQLSEWISQFENSFTFFWRLFNLHSQSFHKFTQVFSKICHKPQTKFEQVYRLDKPIKKYIQEEQSKKIRTKTRWDARLVCLLANFSTEGRGKKSIKEGKYAVSHFRRQWVLPSKEMSKSSKQTT